ncbi:MAG: ferrous iron transport protein A [Candidatus Omnitrophica bacterium]|nr:ferrous iron transport protein A [Candidatus Omnitrophota bacterium]
MSPSAILLTTISSGTKVKIARLIGGRTFKSKITAMGLHVGLVITVIRNESEGPIVVEAKGVRIALGRGMSEKLSVYRLEK